jgi:hypothetical protein
MQEVLSNSIIYRVTVEMILTEFYAAIIWTFIIIECEKQLIENPTRIQITHSNKTGK